MSWFKTNRRGAIILTLLAALVVCAAAPAHVSADPFQGITYDDPGAGGGNGLGDPDQPEGSGKSSKVNQGRVAIGSQHLGSGIAGDDSLAQSFGMWRLYLIRLWQRGLWLQL